MERGRGQTAGVSLYFHLSISAPLRLCSYVIGQRYVVERASPDISNFTARFRAQMVPLVRTANRDTHRALSFHAQIDRFYGGLNADRFNFGHRVFLLGSYAITPEFTVST